MTTVSSDMPAREPMKVVTFRMPLRDLVRFREALRPNETQSQGFRSAAELLIAIRSDTDA